MAETLKTFFSPSLVRRIADDLQGVAPDFPSTAFVADACAGLEALELMARGRHLAEALARHLPPSYPEALDLVLRSLGPEHARQELVGAGMAPFYYLPHVLFVAERGLEHFDLSMRAQYELTKRFTAEFSIRAYLAHDPERCLTFLQRWTRDENAHVRRLVSEGTRLRLPWASRVPWLDRHPERIVALLEELKDDPATLVRRSVANNLNDLGKVHPELLLSTCRAWSKGASAERRALLQHALRTAVKRGETGALALLGFATRAALQIESVSFAPPKVAIGDQVEIRFTLRSTSAQPQDLLVDLAVFFVKARGKRSAKVFKVKRLQLPARGRVELSTKVSLAIHTTRKPYPGRHEVDLRINGEAFPLGAFELLEPAGMP